MKFSSLGLPAPLIQAVRSAGLAEPTPIQSKAIPVILQGNDLIGNAASGSGKTAAFVLPSLARLLDGPQKLRALVLTPTKEHATQVDNHAREFARFTDLRVGLAHSGAAVANQERLLRDPGVDVLVATIDRVLELHERKAIEFEDVEILVLDEADRMVDLGQASDLRKLLKLLPETRQTLLFSATMPAELNRLAKEALIEPVRVDLTAPQPTTGITHAIYAVPRHLKIELLDRLLHRGSDLRSTLVFVRQREAADRLARQLERRKFAVAALHDHKSHTERERIVEDLKRGRLQIVVTTDLAARGLELSGVAHTVNFDVPPTPEDYMHRIQPAGRPEPQGDAFTLMSPEEQRHLAAIERFVGRAIPRVLLPDFDYGLKASQLQQTAIYDDERMRARRAALAKLPFAAARQPSSKHAVPAKNAVPTKSTLATRTLAPSKTPATAKAPAAAKLASPAKYSAPAKAVVVVPVATAPKPRPTPASPVKSVVAKLKPTTPRSRPTATKPVPAVKRAARSKSRPKARSTKHR